MKKIRINTTCAMIRQDINIGANIIEIDTVREK